MPTSGMPLKYSYFSMAVSPRCADCTAQSPPSVAPHRAARGSGMMRAMPRRAKVIPFPGPLERARRAGTLRRQAVVIRGLFESEGIPTLLRSRLAHSVHPFSVGAQGEVVVLVPPSEVARARLLLAYPGAETPPVSAGSPPPR